MKSLIEELYAPQECRIIQEFFSEKDKIKETIVQAIGSKLIIEKNKILTSNPIDILYIICLQATFADSEEECNRVALTVHQYFNRPQKILPMISEDFGLAFATKALIALSFHLQALEHRWKYKGAPTPAYYRKTSKAIFEINGQKDVAEHHEQWETFLGEMFI